MTSNFKIQQEGKTFKFVRVTLYTDGDAESANAYINYTFTDGTSYSQPITDGVSDEIELKGDMEVDISISEGTVSYTDNGIESECCNVEWNYEATGDYTGNPVDIGRGEVRFYGSGDYNIYAHGEICG